MTLKQEAIEAGLMTDSTLSDLVVCCDGDVNPFIDVAEFEMFYAKLSPKPRIHFVAIGNEADTEKMKRFAGIAEGFFVHRPDK